MEAAASSYAMPRRRLVRRFPCNSPLSSRAGPSPRARDRALKPPNLSPRPSPKAIVLIASDDNKGTLMARSTCPGRKFVRAAPSVDPPSPRLRSHCLHGGTHEDLVERHALRAADGEGDDVGDVVRRDRPVEGLLGDPLAVAWVMWSGSSVAVAPGSMTMTRTSGCSSTRSASDQPLIPHLVAA